MKDGSPCWPMPVAYAALLLVVGCSSPDPEPLICAGTTEQPLVNGSTVERYLGLASLEIQSIVELVEPMQPEGALCTGVFVAADWVLTAKHCRQIPSPAIVVHDVVSGMAVTVPVARSIEHETVDVELVQLDIVSAGVQLPVIEPLELAGAEAPPLAVGDVVELAGYGLTAAGTVHDLRFLAESILAMDATTITVSGHGASGACVGDSGGPLLVRGAEGRVAIAGVLSSGSASCRQQDNYVRIDGLRDWVRGIAGTHSATMRDCGTIDAAGGCLYGHALWCAGGELSAARCAEGERCGWDQAAGGYRCLDPAFSTAASRCAPRADGPIPGDGSSTR